MAWDPLHELVALHERHHRDRGGPHGSWSPPVDLYETASQYVVTVELPGFGPGDVAVNVSSDSLTLAGRRPALDVPTLQYLRIERGQGAFTRTFTFHDPVDGGAVEAEFRDGLLTVTVPKAGYVPPRRIEVT
jgi:HSP20 family protein